jgi:hypothetical protein
VADDVQPDLVTRAEEVVFDAIDRLPDGPTTWTYAQVAVKALHEGSLLANQPKGSDVVRVARRIATYVAGQDSTTLDFGGMARAAMDAMPASGMPLNRDQVEALLAHIDGTLGTGQLDELKSAISTLRATLPDADPKGE